MTAGIRGKPPLFRAIRALLPARNDDQQRKNPCRNPPPGGTKDHCRIQHHEGRDHVHCCRRFGSPLHQQSENIHSPAGKKQIVDVNSAAPVDSDRPFCDLGGVQNSFGVAPVMLEVKSADHVHDTHRPCRTPHPVVYPVHTVKFSRRKQEPPDSQSIKRDREPHRPQNQHSSSVRIHFPTASVRRLTLQSGIATLCAESRIPAVIMSHQISRFNELLRAGSPQAVRPAARNSQKRTHDAANDRAGTLRRVIPFQSESQNYGKS